MLLPIDDSHHDGHHDDDGHLTVPEALDLIERRIGKDKMFRDGEPLARRSAHRAHREAVRGHRA